MSLFDRILGRSPPAQVPAHVVSGVQAYSSYDLADPALAEFLRGGATEAGEYVTVARAIFNPAVNRCMSLISTTIGMLPFQLHRRVGDTTEKATDHPLYRLLATRANPVQTAYEFRTLMQRRAMADGVAYAYAVRSGRKIVALVPVRKSEVRVEKTDSLGFRFHLHRDGRSITLPQDDMFWLIGDPADDGIGGSSLIRAAAEAIGIALAADKATARMFRNGTMVGGVLQTDKVLGDTVIQRLRDSLVERFSGSENAGKTLILEDGLKFSGVSGNAKDSQAKELRNQQVEEIARVFGVPRPLLMMDETSWGSGIEQLGLFFVTYCLAHWFVAWEQAVSRSLLTDAEQDTHFAKFNERALLRGSIKDQAEYFAKALGSGGHAPWMEQNEVRDLSDMNPHPDGTGLKHAMAKPPKEPPNEPA